MADAELSLSANYEAYCEMIRTDYPGVLPASREQWIAFNEAMDTDSGYTNSVRSRIGAAEALISWIDGACVDELPHAEIQAAIDRYWLAKARKAIAARRAQRRETCPKCGHEHGQPFDFCRHPSDEDPTRMCGCRG